MSKLIVGADLERTETWIKYEKHLCASCRASCCTMPVEVRFADLLRIGVVDELSATSRRATSPDG